MKTLPVSSNDPKLIRSPNDLKLMKSSDSKSLENQNKTLVTDRAQVQHVVAGFEKVLFEGKGGSVQVEMTPIQRLIRERNEAYLMQKFDGTLVHSSRGIQKVEPLILTRAQVEFRIFEAEEARERERLERVAELNRKLYKQHCSTTSVQVIETESLEDKFGSVMRDKCAPWDLKLDTLGPSNTTPKGNLFPGDFVYKGKTPRGDRMKAEKKTKVNFNGIFVTVPTYRLNEIKAKWNEETKDERKEKVRRGRENRTSCKHEQLFVDESNVFQTGDLKLDSFTAEDLMRVDHELFLKKFRAKFEYNEFQGFRPFIPVGLNKPTTDMMGKFVEAMKECTSSVVEQASVTTDVLKCATDRTTDVVSDTVSGVQRTIDKLSGTVSKLLWVLPLVCISWYIYNCCGIEVRVLYSGFLTILMSQAIPEELYNKVKSFFSKEEEGEEETSVDPQIKNLPLGPLAHLITIVTTFFMVGSKDVLGVTTGFMRTIPKYTNLVGGWDSFIHFVGDIIERFINFVRKMFGKDSIKLFKTGYDNVDEWCNDVHEMVVKIKDGDDNLTMDRMDQLNSLLNKGRDLHKVYRLVPQLESLVKKHCDQVYGLLCSYGYFDSRLKGTRAEPPVLALMGQPGVGKSFLCKWMLSAIISRCVEPEEIRKLKGNLMSKVYNKGPDKYWAGYTGQFACVKDDFGQGVPDGSPDNDYLDLIMMANCWPFPLKMADVESKGSTYFRSKLIMLTTNLESLAPATKVLTCPEAFSRRINFSFEILLNDAYAVIGPDGSRNMNYKAVDKYMAEHGKLPNEAWSFRKKILREGLKTTTDMTTTYTVNDIIEMVSKEVNYRNLSFEDFEVNLSSFILRDLEARDEIQPQMREEFAGSMKTSVSIVERASAAFLETSKLVISNVKRIIETISAAIFGENSSVFNFVFFTTFPIFFFVNVFKILMKKFYKMVFEKKEENVHKRLKKQMQKMSPSNRVKMTKAVNKLLDCHKKKSKVSVKDYAALFEEEDDDEEIEVKKEKETKTSKKENKKKVSGKSSDSDDTSDGEDGEEKIDLKKKKKKKRGLLGRILWRHTTFQGGVTHVSNDVEFQMDGYSCGIVDKITKNLAVFNVEFKEAYKQCGQILFLNANLAMLPAHYITFLENRKDCVGASDECLVKIINTKQDNHILEVQADKFLAFRRFDIPNSDCVVVELPRVISKTNIVHHFMKEEDLKFLEKTKIRLDTVEGDSRPFMFRARHMKAERMDNIPVSGYGGYVIKRTYSYQGFTRNGDCGGTVTIEDGNTYGARRLLGVHVAGNESTGIGYCNIITVEQIQKAMDFFKPIEVVEPQSGIQYCDFPIKGSFTPIGKTGEKMNRASRTKVVATKMRDCLIKSDKVPTKLSPFENKLGEFIDPMEVALTGFSKPIVLYDEVEIAKASHVAFQPLFELTRDHKRRIFTFEEAVEGCPHEYIKGLPRSTSPGYDYNVRGILTKKPIWGDEGPYDFTTEHSKETQKKVYEIIDAAKEGKRMNHYFTDFLKDEVRPIEKVQKGKSRLISAAPLDMSIAFRMYFLSFMSAVQSTRIRNGVGIGINPHKEFDVLAKQLGSKGDKVIAGDFSGFDSSEQPQILWSILDQINDWYDDGEENKLVRRVLWCEVAHSKHLGGLGFASDTFYQWNKSLPSGHPATTIINSFYNLTIFVMVWHRAIQGTERAGNDFWRFNYICTYGDDNILNISDQHIKEFNQVSITKHMAELGMVYTDEKKGTDMISYRKLEEVSFLKRSFRREKDGFVVCPIDLPSLLSSMDWCSNHKLREQITRDSAENFLMELSMHGDTVWDEYIGKFLFAYRDRMEGRPKRAPIREVYLEVARDYVAPWN